MATAAPRTYVDFAPPHSLQEEPDKLALRVDLSAQGFKKEQIRVQIDNFGRLRITGERPLGADGSRWRRFGKEFRVPDTCDAAAIRARLDKDGVLLITMPKLSPASAKAKEPEPEAPRASTGHAAAAAGHQDHGHTGAQQAGAAAAEAEEERRRQEEEAGAAAMERPGQQDEQHPSSDDAAAETAPAAHHRPAAYGFAKDRRRMLLAIFAAMLALVGAVLFATYRLMDPSAETVAPSGSHIVSLSDS